MLLPNAQKAFAHRVRSYKSRPTSAVPQIGVPAATCSQRPPAAGSGLRLAVFDDEAFVRRQAVHGAADQGADVAQELVELALIEGIGKRVVALRLDALAEQRLQPADLGASETRPAGSSAVRGDAVMRLAPVRSAASPPLTACPQAAQGQCGVGAGAGDQP